MSYMEKKIKISVIFFEKMQEPKGKTAQGRGISRILEMRTESAVLSARFRSSG